MIQLLLYLDCLFLIAILELSVIRLISSHFYIEYQRVEEHVLRKSSTWHILIDYFFFGFAQKTKKFRHSYLWGFHLFLCDQYQHGRCFCFTWECYPRVSILCDISSVLRTFFKLFGPQENVQNGFFTSQNTHYVGGYFSVFINC